MTLITQPFFITHNTAILWYSHNTALSITHATQPLCHFNTHIHVFLVESGVVENAVRVSDLLGHGLRLHSAVNTRQRSQQPPAQCSQHKTKQSTAACTVQSTQDKAVNSCLHSAVNTRQSSQQLRAQCSQHKTKHTVNSCLPNALNTRQISQQLPAQCSQHKTQQSTAVCTVHSTQDKAVNSCQHTAVNTRQSSQQLSAQCTQHKTKQSTAASRIHVERNQLSQHTFFLVVMVSSRFV